MRILLVTETWDGHDWGPYETHFPQIRAILQRRGHDLAAVDLKRNYLRLGGETVWFMARHWRAAGWVHINNLIVNRLVRKTAASFQPEMILVTKGENLSWRTVRRLQTHSTAVLLNWDHDSPFWPTNTSMDLLRSMPYWDCFGALAQHFIPVLRSCGCPRAEYVPMFFNTERFALDEDISSADRERLGCDLLFIGRGSPERADMLRPLADHDLAIYGDWSLLADDDPLRPCVRGSYLGGKDYAKAMRCCRIALNVLVTQCLGAHNLRTFEATGCGAFLLTQHSREQADVLFREGAELACFRDPEDLLQKAEHYLQNNDDRRRIAEAGQKRCLREHTLAQRLERIVDIAEDIRA